MPYPMIQFPTFAEFFGMLREKRGITLKDLRGDVNKEGEPPISVHYLEGTARGKIVRCVVDVQDYDARVSPSLHRSICARFDLNQEDFGSNWGLTASGSSDSESES